MDWFYDTGIEPLLLPGGVFNVSAIEGISESTRQALEDTRLNAGEFLDPEAFLGLIIEAFNAATGGNPLQLCEDGALPSYLEIPSFANRSEVDRCRKNLTSTSSIFTLSS